MSRRLRHVPKGEPYEDGTLVEVTCRTIHGRYLLRPQQGDLRRGAKPQNAMLSCKCSGILFLLA
ncbi:MAG: hypothetical protein GY832_17820 [Chloroflexi bacterium]|nr:hypothetical protein [Chloroflexota bacterium]